MAAARLFTHLWWSFFLLLPASNTYGQGGTESLARLLQRYTAPAVGSATAGQKTVHVGPGLVRLPAAGSAIRTGTLDSDRGELHMPTLLVQYDIGLMAGTHILSHRRVGHQRNMSPSLEKVLASFSTYHEHVRCPHLVALGLRGSQVIATVYGDYTTNAHAIPANFWAQVQTREELEQFLAIVYSYQPGTRP